MRKEIMHLFLLLRPGAVASSGLILTFSSVAPRICVFPGAYPDFFFCHAPTSQFLQHLFPTQIPTQAISMRIDSHCQGSVVHGPIPGNLGVL